MQAYTVSYVLTGENKRKELRLYSTVVTDAPSKDAAAVYFKRVASKLGASVAVAYVDECNTQDVLSILYQIS